MSSTLFLVTAALAGLFAGGVFFGGLFLTTQAISESRRPGLVFVSSFLVRVAVVVAGAWFTAQSAGLAGIGIYMLMVIAVRVALVRFTRRRYETDA